MPLGQPRFKGPIVFMDKADFFRRKAENNGENPVAVKPAPRAATAPPLPASPAVSN
jgi:hypothetical protein